MRFCSLDTSGNSRASPLDEKTVNKGMSRSISSIFIYKLSAAKSGNGSLCRYDLTPLADRIGPWYMHSVNMIVKER